MELYQPLRRLIKILFLLTVFFTPLLGAIGNFGYQQAVTFGYEQIKVLFFILSISLISFLWLFQKHSIKLSRISWVGGLFIIILWVTAFLGSDFKGSFLGNYPYFQGLVVYSYLFLFYLTVKSFDINFKYYALTSISSALIVSGLAIEDWVLKNMGYLVPNYAGRVVSTFGQPNFFAGFLLLTLPFSYFLFKNSKKDLSYFGMICGLISIAGIFVSYSRSAILLAMILMALGLIDQLKMKLSLVIFTLAVILISIFIAWKFSSGIVGNEISRPFETHNPDLTKESVEKRAYLWPQIIKIGLEKPIFGYGLENISLAVADYFQINKHKIFEENLNIQPVLISLKDLNIDRTHNYILDLFLFSGIFGVLGWLILVFFILKKCRNKYLLAGLLTYLLWVQFQNQSIVQLIYFWFLVGAIDSL